MTASTQVLSALLCDPDAATQMAGPLLRGLVARPVDPDVADTEASGYLERDVDAWWARIGGRP